MRILQKGVGFVKGAKYKLRQVKAIVVFGGKEDGYDLDWYWGLFRTPKLDDMSKFTSFAKNDEVKAIHILGKDCLLEGGAMASELFDDDDLYLTGTASQLNILFAERMSRVVNL